MIVSLHLPQRQKKVDGSLVPSSRKRDAAAVETAGNGWWDEQGGDHTPVQEQRGRGSRAPAAMPIAAAGEAAAASAPVRHAHGSGRPSVACADLAVVDVIARKKVLQGEGDEREGGVSTSELLLRSPQRSS